MIRPSDWWIIDLALQPDAPQRPAARPRLNPRERNLAARLLVSLIGGAVFIALLVASHHLPAAATPLRVIACLWFAGLVMLKFALWARAEREP